MADGDATETGEAARPARTTIELHAEQAAQAIAPVAAAAQRQWLSTAVNIANVVKKNQRVTHGMFEDLCQLRE